MDEPMRIFFSAGEPSGDQHAAHLIAELRKRDADFQAEGFGGPEMQQQGCDLLFELTQLAVMGFLRVIPLLAKFRRLVKQAEAHFDSSPPDAVLLIDFPGFNWWIAKAAKSRGIPVYYYLPPQLWAWAPWRIRRVRKWIDHVICALPFEFDWYRSRGIASTWVGHPFFDEVAERQLDQAVMSQLSIPAAESQSKTVALLPGSRRHEVERNWPVMLQVVRRVSAAVPNIRWVVGNYQPEHTNMCRQVQSQAEADHCRIEYISGHASEVIETADCCLMVSGSISLELLARRKPGIVLYRAPVIGRLASRFLMTCRFITLTNLIADAEVMPEFISAGNPDRDIQAIAEHLTAWCSSPDALQRQVLAMSEIADRAATTGATERTADLVLQLMASSGDSAAQSPSQAVHSAEKAA
jgi:lipid-A-disaccharide synthase